VIGHMEWSKHYYYRSKDSILGGALDGSGNAEDGYVLPVAEEK